MAYVTAPVGELDGELSGVAVDLASVVGNEVGKVERGVVAVPPEVAGEAEVEGRGLLADVTTVLVLGGEGEDVPEGGAAVWVVAEL